MAKNTGFRAKVAGVVILVGAAACGQPAVPIRATSALGTGPLAISTDLLAGVGATRAYGYVASDGTDYMAASWPLIGSATNIFANRLRGDGTSIGTAIAPGVNAQIVYSGGRYTIFWATSSLNAIHVTRDGRPVESAPVTIAPQVPNGAPMAAAGDENGNVLLVWAPLATGVVQTALWRADGTVSQPRSLGTTQHARVALSYGAGAYLASWHGDSPTQPAGLILAARLDAMGVPLDSSAITAVDVPDATASVRSMFNGSSHVLAFERWGTERGIYLTHVSPSGQVMEGGPRAIATGPGLYDPVAVSRRNDDFLTWREIPTAPLTGGGILGVRVSKSDGVVLDSGPRVLLSGATGLSSVSDGALTASNGDTVLVAARSRMALWSEGASEPPPESPFPGVLDYNQVSLQAAAGPDGYLVRYAGSDGAAFVSVSESGTVTAPVKSLLQDEASHVNAVVAGPDGFLEVMLRQTSTLTYQLLGVRLAPDGTPLDAAPQISGILDLPGRSITVSQRLEGKFGDDTYFVLAHGMDCTVLNMGGCAVVSHLQLLRSNSDGSPRDALPILGDSRQEGSLVALEDGGVALLYVTQFAHECLSAICRELQWDPEQLHALRLPAAGPLGTPIDLGPAPTNPVAASGGGKILLVSGSAGSYTGRFYRPDFSPDSEPFSFGSGHGGVATVVYTDSAFLVSWVDGESTYATRILPDGTVVDPSGTVLARGVHCQPTVSTQTGRSALCGFISPAAAPIAGTRAHAYLVTPSSESDGGMAGDGGGGADGGPAPDSGAGDGGPAQATALRYTGDATLMVLHPARLAATLTTMAGPVAGQMLTFALGAQSCTATTIDDGSATCTITADEGAATYEVVVAFAGGPTLLPSTVTVPLVLALARTTSTYTGARLFRLGHPARLSAILTTGKARPVVGRRLVLSLGRGIWTTRCDGVTDDAGRVTCDVQLGRRPVGPVDVRATFAGDGTFRASSQTVPAWIVAAQPHNRDVADQHAVPGR